MNIKSQEEIDKALAKPFGNVSNERKQAILSHVRIAADTGKLEELHAIFSMGLEMQELQFYKALVDAPLGITDPTVREPSTPPPAKGATNGSAQ